MIILKVAHAYKCQKWSNIYSNDVLCLLIMIQRSNMDGDKQKLLNKEEWRK